MSETMILIAALAFGLLAYVRIASHSRGFSVLIVLLLAAAAIVCIAHFIPCPEGLTYAGKMAIGLMVAGIVLIMAGVLLVELGSAH